MAPSDGQFVTNIMHEAFLYEINLTLPDLYLTVQWQNWVACFEEPSGTYRKIKYFIILPE